MREADARRLSNAIAILRWLAVELRREGSELAHVPREIADVLAGGGAGCQTCGGPVEPVQVGRPRLHCERCRKPRRAGAPKGSQSAA